MTLKDLLLEFDATDLDNVKVDDISMTELESLEKVEKDPKILKKIDELKKIKNLKMELQKVHNDGLNNIMNDFKKARKKDGLE